MITTNASALTHRILLVLFLGLFCTLNLCAQSADLAGIAHVAFGVNDLQKSRAFYRTLGFEEAFEFTDAGKTSVVFMKVSDRQFIELYARGGDSEPSGLLHICFEANDLESVRNAYLRQGLQPTEIKKGRAGNLLFVLHDPEGQMIEYTQYMPGSLHSLDHGKHLGERRISERLLRVTATARDVQSEHAFFVEKLAFKAAASDETELYVAGNSGDKVELRRETPAAKPRIVFAVANERQTERELGSRGFTVQKNDRGVSIVDPDGAVIEFDSPPPGSETRNIHEPG